MYTEKQYFQNRHTRWLKWLCAGVAIVQLILLIAAETGQSWLPLGDTAHWGILLVSGLAFSLLSHIVLVLRVGARGVSLRYFPFQLRFQHVCWDEIRQLRLLPLGECPTGAQFGLPGRDFTHAYWLSTPRHAVLHITLVNGTQLYVSTERPAELLDFLRHGLQVHGRKVCAEWV
ncbi:MAG: hypothetical protein ABMA02_00140 [Saprospiraceae bacterium]